MKILITESQYSKLFKSNSALESAIIDYLSKMMQGTKRIVTPKSRNYGNLREDWCKDGKEFISVHYYFGEMDEDENEISKNFYEGQLFISEHIVNTIAKLNFVYLPYLGVDYILLKRNDY